GVPSPTWRRDSHSKGPLLRDLKRFLAVCGGGSSPYPQVAGIVLHRYFVGVAAATWLTSPTVMTSLPCAHANCSDLPSAVSKRASLSSLIATSKRTGVSVGIASPCMASATTRVSLHCPFSLKK